MTQYFVDLATLTIVLAIAWTALDGWGCLLIKWLGLDSLRQFPCSGVWLGIVAAVFYAQVVQIFFPINWIASCIFSAFGLIFLLTLGSSRRLADLPKTPPYFPYLVAIAAFVALVWASISMPPSRHYDVDLYYEPTINWLNNYSISFGIANLHSRFGFNQSYFPFTALLNAFPLWNHGLATANLLIAAATGLTVLGLCRPMRQAGAVLLLVISLVFVGLLYFPVSPSPDTTVGLLELVMFLALVRLFYDPQTATPEDQSALCAMLLLLGVLGVTVKLSSAIFVAASIAIASGKIYRALRIQRASTVRILIICAIFVGIYFLRGYVVSGYPIYPSALGGLSDASWALPGETARGEVDWIYSWAQAPGKNPAEVLGNWSWIPEWYEAFPLKGKMLFAATGAMFLLALALPKEGPVQSRLLSRVSMIYVPLVSAVVFLFFTAPDLRFLGTIAELLIVLATWTLLIRIRQTRLWQGYGQAVKWSAFILACGLTLAFFIDFRLIANVLRLFGVEALYPTATPQEIGWRIEETSWRIVNLALIFQIFVIFSLRPQLTTLRRYLVNLASLVLSVALMSQMTLVMGFFVNDQQGWRSKPQLEYREVKTTSGLTIHLPVNGDQCGNIPFPCAPSLNPDLRAIGRIFLNDPFDYGFSNLSVK